YHQVKLKHFWYLQARDTNRKFQDQETNQFLHIRHQDDYKLEHFEHLRQEFRQDLNKPFRLKQIATEECWLRFFEPDAQQLSCE
ncbi:MAG: hypothetical protein EBU84_16440, partial [Actinobacteria bacterium]|nr:hypothetical protein [Actinomycetota bacterium]